LQAGSDRHGIILPTRWRFSNNRFTEVAMRFLYGAIVNCDRALAVHNGEALLVDTPFRKVHPDFPIHVLDQCS
jgi:hypothetical protein